MTICLSKQIFIRLYFWSIFQETDKIFVEKRPLDNETEALNLSMVLPKAKFIDIIRDPRT